MKSKDALNLLRETVGEESYRKIAGYWLRRQQKLDETVFMNLTK